MAVAASVPGSVYPVPEGKSLVNHSANLDEQYAGVQESVDRYAPVAQVALQKLERITTSCASLTRRIEGTESPTAADRESWKTEFRRLGAEFNEVFAALPVVANLTLALNAAKHAYDGVLDDRFFTGDGAHTPEGNRASQLNVLDTIVEVRNVAQNQFDAIATASCRMKEVRDRLSGRVSEVAESLQTLAQKACGISDPRKGYLSGWTSSSEAPVLQAAKALYDARNASGKAALSSLYERSAEEADPFTAFAEWDISASMAREHTLAAYHAQALTESGKNASSPLPTTTLAEAYKKGTLGEGTDNVYKRHQESVEQGWNRSLREARLSAGLLGGSIGRLATDLVQISELPPEKLVEAYEEAERIINAQHESGGKGHMRIAEISETALELARNDFTKPTKPVDASKSIDAAEVMLHTETTEQLRKMHPDLFTDVMEIDAQAAEMWFSEDGLAAKQAQLGRVLGTLREQIDVLNEQKGRIREELITRSAQANRKAEELKAEYRTAFDAAKAAQEAARAAEGQDGHDALVAEQKTKEAVRDEIKPRFDAALRHAHAISSSAEKILASRDEAEEGASAKAVLPKG